MSEITYKKAGVDIEEGDRFVDLIAPRVKSTFRKEVMADIGSFGGLFKLDISRYKEPVLVSGTDGVGTKLKVAFMSGRHDTVGIDLVAMCVNDILTQGAEPLFFLDYFATGRLSAQDAAKVIEGIVAGCKESGCALIGGETAEMPGFYDEGEYDLAGFAVGVVDKPDIIDGSRIKAGDAIIGVASSGIHSNGYSLVRKVLFEYSGMGVDSFVEELGCKLGEELLKPTRIYVKAFNLLKDAVDIKGMAHITGGGIPGNLPRILPDGIGAEIDENSWPAPPVFGLVRRLGSVPIADMRNTFNMGIGFIIVVDGANVGKTLEFLNKNNYDSYVIGKTVESGGGVVYV